MVDVISVVLAVIQEILQIADDMEDAGTQAARLARRLAELEGPVNRMQKSIEESRDVYPEANIHRLENLVTKGHDFLRELKGRNLFWKVVNRRSDLDKFHVLNEDIKEVILLFNFELNVRAWEQENTTDRENDWRRLLHIEKMLEEQQKGFEKAKEQIIMEQKQMHEEVMSHLQLSATGASSGQATPDTLQKPANWTEIDRSSIELESDRKVLGSGSSGVVKLARWHGARVAVKIMVDPDGTVGHKIRKLLRELRIHQRLQHEFITQMYGASTSQSHVWLVMEYARMGSLYKHLKRSTEPLKRELQLAFLSDIARGMCFLHIQGILHCDLKSDNVLMCDNGRLKLCDFGMAKMMQESNSLQSRRAGRTEWQAPEIIDEKAPTEKTDLYSFGMVCYEVTTRKRPFAGRKLYQIMSMIVAGERPGIPESCPPGVVNMTRRCWAHNSDDRPASFKDLVEALDRMLEGAGGDPRHRQELVDTGLHRDTCSQDERDGDVAETSKESGGGAASPDASWGGAGTSNAKRNGASGQKSQPPITAKMDPVKYDYSAQGPRKPTLKKGELVRLHTDMVDSKGWALGRMNTIIGRFPGNFVERIPSGSEGRRSSLTRGALFQQSPQQTPGGGERGGNGGGGGGGIVGRGEAQGGTGSAEKQGQGQGQGQGQNKRHPPPPHYRAPLFRGSSAATGEAGGGARSDRLTSAATDHNRATNHLGEGGSGDGIERRLRRTRQWDAPAKQAGHLLEQFSAVKMVKNQAWMESLTPMGRMTYNDLLAFMMTSRILIDFDDIEITSVIGSGAYSSIFRGIYRSKRGRGQEGKVVAVKKPVGSKGGTMEKILNNFRTECMLLLKLKHRNIIALEGVTTRPVTYTMQFCSRGNLMELLDDRSAEITFQRKKQMMLDVATGMQYLHSQTPVILHRDLKSPSILIDGDWVAKVTGFGLTRYISTSSSEWKAGKVDTYPWMAPEVIDNQDYTKKADVFSYGIISWEICTRAVPYGGMQPMQMVSAVLEDRERPHIPSKCPAAISELMKACWEHEPGKRPSFPDVVSRLESLL